MSKPHLLPRLGLPHQVGVGTAAGNKVLDVLDLLLLLHVLLHLVDLWDRQEYIQLSHNPPIRDGHQLLYADKSWYANISQYKTPVQHCTACQVTHLPINSPAYTSAPFVQGQANGVL